MYEMIAVLRVLAAQPAAQDHGLFQPPPILTEGRLLKVFARAAMFFNSIKRKTFGAIKVGQLFSVIEYC